MNSKPFRSIIFIIVISLSSIFIQFVESNASYLLKNNRKCTENNLKKIELKIAKMMPIGKYARKMPENLQQTQQYCKETIAIVQESEQFFQQCFTKQSNDLSKILVYTLKQNIKIYCRNNQNNKQNSKRLTKLLSIAPCFNKHISKAEHCINDFMNKTKQLIVLENDKDKIKYSCCNYVDSMNCARNVLDQIHCTKDNNDELIMDTIRGLLGNFVNYVCGDFDEQTDQCEKLGPQPPIKDAATLKVINKKEYLTPIFLLLDLLDSMKNFQNL